MIGSFTGRYGWLSNFARAEAQYDGRAYPTAEHAFAAAKTVDDADRARIAGLPTPAEAKHAGRAVELRPGWDRRVRFEAMAEILRSKFQTPGMSARLAGTGDTLLVEGNEHHDQTWGDCRCPRHVEEPGENHLGRLLMVLRGEIRGDRADRWVRVGFTGHRKLPAGSETWVSGELSRVLRKLRTKHAAATLICGMAMGADLLAAEAALNAGLSLWAYVPFPDQDARWPSSWVDRRTALLSQANRTVVLGVTDAAAGPRGRYLQLLFGRNRLIVRDADVLVAVHDRSLTTGGTFHTVGFARQAGVPVITIDPAGRTVTVTR